MALNFTTPNSFSPNSTIASAAVNANFSAIANVFTGLEAETSTLSKLKIDADPTTALEVTTKQYVDHYSTWRRPRITAASVTTVTVESGLDGTSGDIPILFPDGSIRTETSATRTTFNITRNASLLTSTAQSGLRTTLSEATNTWYALYAVKVTDSSTQWCTVGDTVLPLQANYATLNSNFGTSGWVYLGLIRNGDNATHTGDILDFRQSGNTTVYFNAAVGTTATLNGILLATSAGTASLTYTYSAGTGTTDIPANIRLAYYSCSYQMDGTQRLCTATCGGVLQRQLTTPASAFNIHSFLGIADSSNVTVAASSANMTCDIFLVGFIDTVLGVGSNPLL